jgi:integrase
MGISHQKGWVRLRGKKWYGYFRRTELDPANSQSKLNVAQVILGTKPEMSKYEAREKLEREIVRLGGQSTGDQSVVNGAVTFEWFVNNRYLPLKETDWREETAKVKKHLIQADLVDTFADARLENIDKFSLQTHLNRLAQTRSRDRVLQVRAYLQAIFAEAVDQDFIGKDPARTIKVPAHLKESDKTVLSWDQLRAVLSRLGHCDRIVLELEMTNALRPSELFGLKWKCFDPATSSIKIEETTYKGKIRPWGKTKGSLATIPIASDLAEELQAWRIECREEQRQKKHWNGPTADDPEGFIFPARDGGFIDTGNYRRRVLHKFAKELGLPKLTFQVIRRTVATLARKKGDIKDVQGVLRHSRTATTTDVYMQELPEGVRATVNSIHQELTQKGGGNGDRGPGTSKPSAKNAKVLSFGTRKPVRQIAHERGGSVAIFSGR